MDEAWHEPVAVFVDGQVHDGRDGLILFEPFYSVQFLFRLPAVLKAVVTFSSILVLTFGLFFKVNPSLWTSAFPRQDVRSLLCPVRFWMDSVKRKMCMFKCLRKKPTKIIIEVN